MSGNKRKKLNVRRGLMVFAAVAFILALLRIILPYAVEWTLNNRVLNDLGDYQGRIEDVDIQLWAGTYHLNEMTINKKAGDQFKPFFKLDNAQISLSWKSLWHGMLSVDLEIVRPQISFEDAAKKEDRQSGDDGNWQALLDQTVPFRISSVKIYDGQLNFYNRDSNPKVDIGADNINLHARNLTNIEGKNGERVAEVDAQARLFKSANAVLSARFDPFAYDDFQVAARIEEFQLKDINDAAKAYAKIDFASGHGTLLFEMSAVDAQLEGYLKPFFENVDVLEWQQDVERDGDNIFRFLWEGVVDLVESVFTNQRTDQLATEIVIEGSLDEQEVNTWQAVWGVFKNAFIDALNERFNKLTPLTSNEEGES